MQFKHGKYLDTRHRKENIFSYFFLFYFFSFVSSRLVYIVQEVEGVSFANWSIYP